MSKLCLWKAISFLCVFCALEAIGSPAQTFKTLVSFNGTDGENPGNGSLVQGLDGNFYGTTYAGGANKSCTTFGVVGCGTVFRITPCGELTTLHSFDGTDGANPTAGLVLATDGNFYGTTEFGGNNACSQGCGTVFKITPAGKLTTLHSFDGTDGEEPSSGLVQATDGNFYGTAYTGGTPVGAYVYGTIFKITPGGKLTTLHSFDGTDGWGPEDGLVQATNGSFYGTTVGGGVYDIGTVFKMTPAGTLTTLHSFGGTDGSYPYAALVLATNGNFYGTTSTGGANTTCTLIAPGCGTVFEITAEGKLTTLHSFDGTDGSYVIGGLVQATDGNFYGTTANGGVSSICTGGCGTIFEITPAGKLTSLHSFDGTAGSFANSGLAQGTNGSFYGTTNQGGAGGSGTVFSLSVGLGPFVETLPTSGKVASSAVLLGNNLTGVTGVAFNGTAATFTVVSSSEIKTTVPQGATTGKVRVKTPHGTLTSNVNFRVTP